MVGEHTEDVVFKRLQDVTPATIAAAAKRLAARTPNADGIYLPCNQWDGTDAVPLIEKETGLPVVAARTPTTGRRSARSASTTASRVTAG